MQETPTIEKIRPRKGGRSSRSKAPGALPSWEALRDQAARARPWRLTDRWASDERPSLVPSSGDPLADDEDEPVKLSPDEEAAIRIMRQLGESFGGEPMYACLAVLPLKLASVTACLAMLDDGAARAMVKSYLEGQAGLHRTAVRAAWRVRECLGLVGPAQSS